MRCINSLNLKLRLLDWLLNFGNLGFLLDYLRWAHQWSHSFRCCQSLGIGGLFEKLYFDVEDEEVDVFSG